MRTPKDMMDKDKDENVSTDADANADANGEANKAAGAEAGAPEGGFSELLEKLDQATAEISAHRERYLRTVADLENYRKRALREKEEARRQANFGLVEDLLPVLDNFKLGLKSAETHEGGAAFAEGFRMILGQMENALKQNGLEEINPDNGPFDPNFHEAMAHVPHAEVTDGHIIEVHRIGYKLHERLLRPAAVIISSGPPPDGSGESAATDREDS